MGRRRTVFFHSEQIVNGVKILRVEEKRDGSLGECVCPNCGSHFFANLQRVRHKITKSCGCAKSIAKTKHGFANANKQSTEYKIWAGIKSRCENKNTPAYEGYGGRGIKMCDRWRKSFVDFLHDVGFRPSSNLSLDRINNDGNYEPGNVKWSTQKEQCRNTRKTLLVDWRGERLPLKAVCENENIDYRMVWSRINVFGMSVESAINKPVRSMPKGRRGKLVVEYKGRTMKLNEWCAELDLDYAKMRWMIFIKGIDPCIAFDKKV